MTRWGPRFTGSDLPYVVVLQSFPVPHVFTLPGRGQGWGVGTVLGRRDPHSSGPGMRPDTHGSETLHLSCNQSLSPAERSRYSPSHPTGEVHPGSTRSSLVGRVGWVQSPSTTITRLDLPRVSTVGSVSAQEPGSEGPNDRPLPCHGSGVLFETLETRVGPLFDPVFGGPTDRGDSWTSLGTYPTRWVPTTRPHESEVKIGPVD